MKLKIPLGFSLFNETVLSCLFFFPQVTCASLLIICWSGIYLLFQGKKTSKIGRRMNDCIPVLRHFCWVLLKTGGGVSLSVFFKYMLYSKD